VNYSFTFCQPVGTLACYES